MWPRDTTMSTCPRATLVSPCACPTMPVCPYARVMPICPRSTDPSSDPTSVPCFSRFWNWGQNSRRRIHLSFSGSVSPGSRDPCAKADVTYGACHQHTPASLLPPAWPSGSCLCHHCRTRPDGASHAPCPAQSPQLCPSRCLSLPHSTSTKGCFANGLTGSHEGCEE